MQNLFYAVRVAFVAMLVLITATVSVSAQFVKDPKSEIESLYKEEKFAEIVQKYAKIDDSYGAKEYYFIGFACYMLNRDEDCVKYMKKSIEYKNENPEPYFFAGTSLMYKENFGDALPYLRKAFQINSQHEQTANNLARCYAELNYPDSAMHIYRFIIANIPECKSAYKDAGDMFMGMNLYDSAVVYYIAAQKQVSPQDNNYMMINYNLALAYYLSGQFSSAEKSFMELHKSFPNDYVTISKIVQSLYAQKKYNEAQKYKDMLYAASKDGKLKEELSEMFCFDQFKVNGTLVMAFETYQEGGKKIFEKHKFLVAKSDGSVDYKIVNEYEPISAELKVPKYVLCSWKDGVHYNYGIGNNGDDYDSLKKAVIAVIEGKLKPSASFVPGKK